MHKLRQGMVHVIEESEFESLLASGLSLRIKAGFDPTAPDLHLGHAVLLKKLREFQDAGHTVVMIVGTATAAIGDPTGRNQMRPPLSDDEINTNAWTYMRQAFKILDKERTVVKKNSEWFSEFRFDDVVRLMSNFTLSQVTLRDDFKKRMASCTPIFLHELLYPLMQAYDSFREGVDIELGGNDQFFNLMMGRDYMRLRGDKAQVIATVPLLVGLDGVQKMSKSLGNHIGLTDEPFEMYSKVMSISDATMQSWNEILFPDRQIFPQEKEDPKFAKQVLACRIVTWLHTNGAAYDAEQEWMRVFSRKENPTDIEAVQVDLGYRLDKLIAKVGLAPSISEAGRLIKAGAVEVNGCKALDNTIDGTELTVRVGRKWMKISALN
jgi:tyrosyl-tRNA synthetase